MTKLAETSETAIAITFLAMNLMTLLIRVMRGFFGLFYQNKYFYPFLITFAYILEINQLF
jgi:hypothetical protein